MCFSHKGFNKYSIISINLKNLMKALDRLILIPLVEVDYIDLVKVSRGLVVQAPVIRKVWR